MKHKKLFNRLTALILTIAVTVTSVNLEALADTESLTNEPELLEALDESEDDSSLAKEQWEEAQNAFDEPEPLILSELEDERTASTKTFVLSDGSFLVAQYQNPVHYETEEGEWEVIDNTLSEVAADAEDSDGSFGTTKASGKEEVIKLSKKMKEGKTVSIKTTDYPIRWGIADAAKVTAVLEAEESRELSGNEKFLCCDTGSQTILYQEIFDGVDAEYMVRTDGIKENIILK